MERFDDFLITLSQLWDWLRGNKKWVFSRIGIFVLTAFGVFIRRLVTRPRPAPSVTIHNSDQATTKAIEVLSRELERKEQALTDTRQSLADAWQRDQSPQAALAEAVSAIPEQTEIPNAQARIQEALAQATQGNTGLAEAILSKVETRKIAEGEAAFKEAAEAARHRGPSTSSMIQIKQLPPTGGQRSSTRRTRTAGIGSGFFCIEPEPWTTPRRPIAGSNPWARPGASGSFWQEPTANWVMSIESAGSWTRPNRCTANQRILENPSDVKNRRSLMQASIILDDQLVKEAFTLSGIKTERKLIEQALKEFVEHRKRLDLRDLKGIGGLQQDYDFEEAEIRRQVLLRDSAVGSQPGTQQGPKPFHRVDMDFVEAIPVFVMGILPGVMADRFVLKAPFG